MKILVLQEGKYQGQTGYHFTDMSSALAIMQSDLMRATNSPTSKGMFKELNKGIKSWSITREQHGFAYRNFKKQPIRFDIDLWKLSNNQKIKGAYVDASCYAPIQYKSNGQVDVDGIEFEYEMRPIGDTKNFHKFVKSITICLDTNGSELKKKVEQLLVSGKNSDSKVIKDAEEKVKLNFPALFKVLNICEDEKHFKDILREDIDKNLGENIIDFKDYVKSDLFEYNYAKIIEDCNLAIKMIESLTIQNVSVDTKGDSEFSDRVTKIIMDNDSGSYANMLKFLSKDSKWKDIPIIYVDKKGINLSFIFIKG